MITGGGPLAGKRVLVVGASAGIGRAFAMRAVRAGAEVVLVARRAEALQDVVAEAGGGHAVAADICDAAGPAALVAEVAARLAPVRAARSVGATAVPAPSGSGGDGAVEPVGHGELDGASEPVGQVDLVVHCAGAAPLRLLVDSDAEDWRRTLEINVVAVNRLIQALVPHVAPGGIVAVLTSEAAARPWTGMVHYAASKAAQEAALKGWRLEHPEVRFAAVAVGPTQPTEFGDGFDPDLLGRTFADWAHHGMLPETYMDTDDLAGVLIGTLTAALAHPGIGIEHLVLRSPSPAMGRKDIHGPR